MYLENDSAGTPGVQQAEARGHERLKGILDSLDPTEMLERLSSYRGRGRRGYPLESMWRAVMVSYIEDIPNICALVRRLQDDPALRRFCGFDQMPHRSTFVRFYGRLSKNPDVMTRCLSIMGDSQEFQALPDYGKVVAVDSTHVESHSNPWRSPKGTLPSDPEAGWVIKTHRRGGKEVEEAHFGYRLHLMVDAHYGLPITSSVTAGNVNDVKWLLPLMDEARRTHDWFAPRAVTADRGYESDENFTGTMERGAAPIIPIRRPNNRSENKDMHKGLYSTRGEPTCIGKKEMTFVGTDPARGHFYRCAAGGCQLKDRKGVVYCRDAMWVDPAEDPRMVGPVPRSSDQWKALYEKRQSVERVFKSLKESRRLERHCFRGRAKITLHCLMSLAAFSATALYGLRNGLNPRRMVRMVP